MVTKTTPTELARVLNEHARSTSALADLVSGLEQQWLQFAHEAKAEHMPLALDIITRLDVLRSRMLDQMVRISALERPKVNVNVRESAILVAQDSRRANEAD